MGRIPAVNGPTIVFASAPAPPISTTECPVSVPAGPPLNTIAWRDSVKLKGVPIVLPVTVARILAAPSRATMLRPSNFQSMMSLLVIATWIVASPLAVISMPSPSKLPELSKAVSPTVPMVLLFIVPLNTPVKVEVSEVLLILIGAVFEPVMLLSEMLNVEFPVKLAPVVRVMPPPAVSVKLPGSPIVPL
jgi:hypothetical protein